MRAVVRRPLLVVLATVVLTALLATQLRHLHVEIRRRANLPDDHPYVQVQNRISDLFGGEAVVIVGVVAAEGDVFARPLLAKVKRITDGLRATAGVVETSLFGLAAPHVRTIESGADGLFEVRPLMEEAPATDADAGRVRHAVERDRLLRETLVSADRTATVIVAEFDDRLTDADLMARVEAVVAPERDDTVRIALAGAPVLRAALRDYTRLIAVLFPLAVLVIGLVHYEAFRTLQALVLPLVTALLSVVWALGVMGALRLPMDTWSALTPVLILAVAAGHAVQILKRYYEEYAAVGDNTEAVVRAVTAVGPVMLTAGVIAASGFASLTTFGVTSVRVFGLLLASGIVSALVIELTFTPAFRCLLRAPRLRETTREAEARRLDAWLGRLADAVVAAPGRVLAVALGGALACGAGTLFLRVDNSFRFWFAPSTTVRQDDALLNEKLAGTATVRLLVAGAHDGALREPAVLRALADLGEFLAEDPDVGGVSSIADHVRRMHRAMHADDPAYHAVPDEARLVAQYLFLYEMGAGPDGLTAFVDAPYRNGVVRALSKSDGAAFSRDLIARLDAWAAHRFAGLPVALGIAGGTIGVQTALNEVVVHEKLVNVVQVSAIIFVLSALFLRSLAGGAVVLVPLALAVAVTLGLMGWTGTWLDMTTAAITAMGVSIGADFAIYLIFRMREEIAGGAPLVPAVRAALRTSGKAIFFVSSAVVAGYLVLPLSGFSIWARLGFLTGLIVTVSALATLAVVPAIALLLRPRFLGSPPAYAGDAPSTRQALTPP